MNANWKRNGLGALLALCVLGGIWAMSRPGNVSGKESASARRLDAATRLHEQGVALTKGGERGQAIPRFSEAYQLRHRELGPTNQLTYDSLRWLAFVSASEQKTPSTMQYLVELRRTAPMVLGGLALEHENHLIDGELGQSSESNPETTERSVTTLGRSQEDLTPPPGVQPPTAIGTDDDDAQADFVRSQRAIMDQARLGLLAKADDDTNMPSFLVRLGANSSQWTKMMQYREAERSLARKTLAGMRRGTITNFSWEAFYAQLPKPPSGIHLPASALPKLPRTAVDVANLGIDPEELIASLPFGADGPKVPTAEDLPDEGWFDAAWERWNTSFEAGYPLAQLLSQRQARNPFVGLPPRLLRDSDELGRAVLNLKGLLMEREFRLQQAMGTATDPVLAGWRSNAWTQAALAAQNRPAPLSLVELQTDLDGSKMTEWVRKSGISQKYAQAEQDARRKALALPGTGRPPLVTVDSVRQALPPHTVLVEYFRFGARSRPSRLMEEHYGALVIAPQQAARQVDLGLCSEIDARIDEFTLACRKGEGDAPSNREFGDLLGRLSDDVWQPVKKLLPAGCSAAAIAPDGRIHLVPFAALREDRGFLVESYRLCQVLGGRDLLNSNPLVDPTRGAEVWLDPTFGAATPPKGTVPSTGLWSWIQRRLGRTRGGADLQFDPLPGTRAEASGLSALSQMPGGPVVRIHQGPNATEARLLAVDRPFLLHFATHGFFDAPEQPLTKAAWPPPDFDTDSQVELPMYRSGLALAGAQSTVAAWKQARIPSPDRDGIVTAAEASLLRLDGTWLVTLSACDTGVGGTIDGECILSLKQGFLNAGPRNLLFTLWRVRDSYAPEFMRQFYADAFPSRDPAGALSRLQAQEFRRISAEPGDKSLWRAVKLAGPFVVTTRGAIGLPQSKSNVRR